MRNLYLLGFPLLVFACSTKPSDPLRLLEGSYYYAFANDNGEFYVEENCTVGAADKLSIRSENNVYRIYQEGFDTVGYTVQTVTQNGSEIVVEAFGDDIDGESENPIPKKFSFVKGAFLSVKQDEREFTLISVDSTKQFYFRTCQEAMENEGDSNESLYSTLPTFDEATKEGQLLAEFFKLIDPEAEHPIYFNEGQKITLESPGPGVMPMIETIENGAKLKEVKVSRLSGYSTTLLTRWYHSGMFSMQGLEFRCEPTKAGVFIAIAIDSASKFSSAELSLVDDSAGEPQTQFVLHFVWDENQALILTKIDVTDCSA